MGFLDFSSRVVTTYKADVSDHVKQLQKLKGEQAELRKDELAAARGRNDELESWSKNLGKATIALGAVAAAGALLWEGWEYNVRKAQLSSNVFVGDLEKLRTGFGGLRTEMQSLETANGLAQSKFKLTSDQMETVGKAMRELVREGRDWDDVTKKVTESIVKLEGDGLKDFGIHVRDATTEGDKFNAIMEAMASKASRVTDTTRTSAEEMVGLKTKFADVMDHVKQSLGEIAVAFVPIVEALANTAGYVASIVNMLPGGGKAFTGLLGNLPGGYSVLGGLLGGLGSLGGDSSGGGTPAAATPLATSGPMFDVFGANRNRSTMDDSFGPSVHDITAEAIGGAASNLRWIAYLAGGKPAQFLANIAKRAKASGTGGVGGSVLHQLGSVGFDDDVQYTPLDDVLGSATGSEDLISSIDLSQYGRTATAAEEYNAFNSSRAQSKLASVFGPIEEFDTYAKGFQMLSGAVGSAMEAWIDGSSSAGEAFKKFIGEALKAMAVQMAMEALKHGAYALGSLAFGDFRGAAAHGKAAAAFAVGAVAVGAAAKSMHGGSSSSAGAGAGAAAPTYSGTAGAGSGGGGMNNTIVIGQEFSEGSARQRQLAAQRLVNRAMGSPGVTYA